MSTSLRNTYLYNHYYLNCTKKGAAYCQLFRAESFELDTVMRKSVTGGKVAIWGGEFLMV